MEPFIRLSASGRSASEASQAHATGLVPDRELRDGESPIERSSVFAFRNGKQPEAALLLDREGGVIVPCDAYQNWTTFEGCSPIGRVMMKAMGFGPTLIGGPWVGKMGRDVKKDFDVLGFAKPECVQACRLRA